MSVEAGRLVLSRGLPASALILAVAGIGLLAAGCTAPTGSAQTAAPGTTVAAAPASVAPSVALTSTPSPTPEDFVFADLGSSATWLVDKPLSDLSPDVASAAEVDGGIGVAVLVPSLGVVYELNGDSQYELASVAKVPIMLTLLSQAVAQGRALTDTERYELTRMIEESDNDAADWLYADAGYGDGVRTFLQSVGIYDSDVWSDWGDATLSPMDAAKLMAQLAGGTILDAPSRELAMELLSTVDPAQSWGAVSLASYAGQTGVKNGWYPEFDGWVLNSTGYVLDAGTAPDYTIAVFTNGQVDFYDGIDTVEAVGERVYQALAAQTASR